MKKCIFCLVLTGLLLCSCAVRERLPAPEPTREQLAPVTEVTVQTQPETVPTTEAPVPPEFASTPQRGDTVLIINGTALSGSYLSEEMPYLCLSELCELPDVQYTQQIGEGTHHTCTVQAMGQTFELNTESCAAMEGHTVHALGGTPLFDGENWYLPTNGFLKALGLSVLPDEEQNTVFYTAYPKADKIEKDREIPVLMYHAVSDYCWGEAELFVSPSVLDAQIALLLENGYTLITFEDLDRLDEIEKPVMLTFDDGYDDNYDCLFPILQKYQAKATVFVIVNDIGRNHKLTEDEIKEMADSGLVSIQSHTLSHNYLSYMGAEQLDRELQDSKLALARLTGREPFVLCYPTGMYSALSLEKTAESYEFGLLMSKGLYVTGEDPYRIPRYYIPRGLSAEGLLQKIG